MSAFNPLRRAQAALAGVDIDAAKRDVLLTIASTLADYQGLTANSQPGCELLAVPLGDSEALIEFEYSAGRPGRLSGPPEFCYEDEPEEITVIQVLVNGTWIDADLFSTEQIERWHQQISDAAAENRESARDEAAIQRYQDARD